MKKTTLALALTLASASSLAIEGGLNLHNPDYDNIVKISFVEHGKSKVCTGTLIASKYVLTAAHCAKDDTHAYFADGTSSKASIVYSNYDEEENKDLAIFELFIPYNHKKVNFFEDINTLDFSKNIGKIDIYGFATSSQLKTAKFDHINNEENGSLITVPQDETASMQGGDSGGAWINDKNKIISVTTGGTMDIGFGSVMSANVITEAINGYHFAPVVSSASKEIEIEVQSLHDFGVADNAYTEGNYQIVGGSCVGANLDAFEICTYELEGEGYGKLHLSDVEAIEINKPQPEPQSETNNTATSNNNGEGGSGGSMGWLMLLGLGSACGFRNFKKKRC